MRKCHHKGVAITNKDISQLVTASIIVRAWQVDTAASCVLPLAVCCR